MAGDLREAIHAVLREAGPLTLDQLLPLVAARQPIASKNPKQTVRNSLTNDPSCASMNGRYVYLPSFVNGAGVRMSMKLPAPEGGVLFVPVEAHALICPVGPWEMRRRVTLLLDKGPTIPVDWRFHALTLLLGGLVELPGPFWQWWAEQAQGGADALLVAGKDGEAGRYLLRPLCTTDLDPTAVAARNDRLREAAAAVMKRTRAGLSPQDLAFRLLASGVYHGEPAPDSLPLVLLQPGASFYVEGDGITYRPDISPAMQRLFADRLYTDLPSGQGFLSDLTGLMAGDEDEEEEVETEEIHAEDESAEESEERAPERPPQQGYRIKVTLQWMRHVWRVIEILDNQTLEDLHYAIQDAFDWDDDHLYSFFLSGKAWDPLTEVGRPGEGNDVEPPLADEVVLADLELRPGQTFLYIFDFGDELRHQIQVLGSFPLPEGVDLAETYPRIAESHGKAPPQYPGVDDDEDEEDEDGLEELDEDEEALP